MQRSDCTPQHVRRIPLAFVLLALLVLTLVGTSAKVAHAAPPVNPSDGQINSAAAQKAALAEQVGQLSARVATQQNQIRQLQAAQEMAEQVLAYKLSLLEIAKQGAVTAQANVAKAQRGVDAAQQQFATFMQAAYMSGSIGGMTGSLLTADDPNVVLQQSSMQQYETDHQLDAIGAMKRASVAKSNADAQARLAVQKRKSATAAAAQAKSDADAAVVSALAQQKQLEASLAQNQAALESAQLKLATLNNQRAAYLAYQEHQRQLAIARAKAKALAEKQAREAAARALAAEKVRQAREAARQQRLAAQNAATGGSTGGNGGGTSSSGGGASSSGGGSGGGSGGSDSAPTPSGGSWTAAKGQAAVNRAMQYLGWMYAWAGGNASGPTYGVCAGDGAYNDCHVRGFDCSGLTLYGWAPYESFPHFSVTQYNVGSVHPSISDLMPGDLVFWSSNGAQSGVHHVAMYIGNGNVIQAPQSGSVIQITPLLQVNWGYFGATRPLT